MVRSWPLRRLAACSLPVLAVLVLAASAVGGWLTPADFAQAQDDARPKVTAGPTIASSPARGDTYRAGEAITVTLTFSEPVTVTGKPRLRLKIGEQKRWAGYAGADGATLSFTHSVKPADADPDGIAIGRNQLRLNGGTIGDVDGNDARLKHQALPDQPGHKVNGGPDEPEPTPTPTPEPPASNNEPYFTDNTAARSVAENTAAGEDVGAAVTATDDDGDTLTYALAGADAGAFDLDSSTGQLTVRDALDYEARASYTLTVTVSDGKDAAGEADNAVDDTIAVTVSVLDVDEAGTVAFDSKTPRAGSELTAALSDPNGSVTGVAWAWESSTDRTTWNAIAGAGQAAYAPVTGDAGKYLRATARYADGHGSGKSARAMTVNPAIALLPGQHLIEDSGIGAWYEVNPAGIQIKWPNPVDDQFNLILKTAGSSTWNIYFGGHDIGSALVELAAFNLAKTDTLQGRFRKYTKDGNLVEEYSEFTIDLSTVEFPPHAAADAATTPEDTAVDVSVVANDTDLEDATLSVSSITQPANGSAVLKSGSSTVITYTPNQNFHGPDSFTYTVSDGALTADTMVSVKVHPVNDAPTLAGPSGVDYAENGISDVATYSVVDPDAGDSHTWSLSGTDAEDFDLSSGGALSFKDPPDFEGKSGYRVTVTAADRSGASASISVVGVGGTRQIQHFQERQVARTVCKIRGER